MAEATPSSKNQIDVPRETLGGAPGEKLLIVVRGDAVVTFPQPRSFTNALRGLAKPAAAEDYLVQERASWE